MNTVIILRGAMGCGKSTLAETLFLLSGDVRVVSADHWFVEHPEVPFSGEALREAHGQCHLRFLQALEEQVRVVVVDNTNQLPRDYEFYHAMGTAAGYRIHQIVVENRHGGSSTKPVPEHIVTRARSRILGDLIL